jgi:hypothetical protein
MKLSQSVKMGALLFITLNLLMALGSIWVFTRMTPAIKVIIDRNVRSLQACEDMLSSLAMISEDEYGNKELKKSFIESFTKARNNLTEEKEPAVLEKINRNFPKAFEGDFTARKSVVDAIVDLGEINRAAMIEADNRARQLGGAGAWGVVFMAVIVFIACMLFIRGVVRGLVKPFEEIHSVIVARRNGDTMRRCTDFNLPKDIKTVFSGLNEFLDKANS